MSLKPYISKLLATILILFIAFQAAADTVERVEPPFWWAGMENQDLQLMVYGKDFAELEVRSANEAVQVVSVKVAENPNYAFINLKLTKQLEPGSTELSFFKQGEQIHTLRYVFKPRRDNSAQRQGFSAKDVIYLATPDRFVNGDTSNDNIDALYEKVDRSKPGGRHGGDLQGLKQALPYLHQLGITQVWLNPILENNQEEYSYHGYSISDLYQVDARFGGNEALLDFVAAARQKGIGLIMDTIPNHIGLNHWWMSDLPSQDWINNKGQFTQTSHSHEKIQDPYALESDKADFNDGWFVPTMPDLNQRNEELATYLIQNNIWWIEYADLTGLRVDTLPYADKYFTQKFADAILAEYPKLNIVGEEWSTNIAIVSYWQRGKTNQDGYLGSIPSLMDFPLQDELITSLNEAETWNTGIKGIHDILANDFQYPDPSNLVVIGDNHDMNRLFTWLEEDYRKYKMALVFLMTTRGIPQLFYGTEILMKNPGTEDHGIIRSDFPGGWPGDKVNAFTGEGLSQQAKDAQAFVTQLLNWRKNTTAIHSGELIHFLPKEGVYTYFRRDDQKRVMVVLNNAEEARRLDLSRFSEVLEEASSKRDIFTGKSTALGESIQLDAKSAYIFELN